MKMLHRGLLSLAFVILESALVPIALNVGGIAIGVVPLLFFTSLVSTITLAFISYFEDRGEGFFRILRSKKTLIPLLVAGFLGFGITQLLQNIGTVGTNPSISAVVWRSWVIMVAVLTPPMLKQKVTRRQYASVLLGFASVYLIASKGLVLSLNMQQLPFIAALLASGFALSLSTLMAKKYNATTTGFVLLASISTLVFSAPLTFFYWQAASLVFSANVILVILFLGVIDAGIGAVFYYHSFKTFSTPFAGSALLSIPFFTILLSYLLIGTPIEWYYLVAAIVLAAAIFVQGDQAITAPERTKSASTIDKMQIFDITSAFISNKDPLIYGAVQGSGRALAIKLERLKFDASRHTKIFDKNNCAVFTTASPHPAMLPEEVEFIRELMGLNQEEDALISIGYPKNIERAFGEFMLNTESDRLPKSELF
jgi:drug/metabolite transporter (DMT)-like permease